MLISDHSEVRSRDVSRYAWAELRKFLNVRYTFDVHTKFLSVPAKYRKFAEKQAENIKFSLIQAREYAIAAQSATLATKPVLMYYCCMSLALAEILMKQSGESSLEMARAEHNHHGLSIQIDEEKIRKKDDFISVASALKAVPMIKGGNKRAGTFELWHRSARGMPAIGKHFEKFRGGATVLSYRSILYSPDEEFVKMDKNGMNLLFALSRIPGLSDALSFYGVDTEFLRGKVEHMRNDEDNSESTSIIIHPVDQELSDEFFSSFRFRSPIVDGFNFSQARNHGGGIFSLRRDRPYFDKSTIPDCVNTNLDETKFWKNKVDLNEFGFIYVSLHILGNFARYFPDLWIKSIEKNDQIVTVAERLLELAEERLPLLSLSELSRSYHICVE